MNLPSRRAIVRTAADNVLRLKQAVSLVWESSPGLTLAGIVLIIVQGSLPLASLYLMKLIVDSITAGAGFDKVLLFISLAGGVALLVAACNSASNVISEAQSDLVSDHVQEILHAKSIEVDLEYYENPKYYETLHRAQAEALSRPTQIVNGLLQVGRSAISLVAVFGLIVSLNWALALTLTIVALPSAFIHATYANKLYSWQRSCTRKERKAWYRHWLLISEGYAKEIRLFNLGPLFMRQYHELHEEIRKTRLSLVSRRSVADLASQTISLIAVFGSLAFIARQTLLGTITLGSMVMYFGAIQQGQAFLSNFLTNMAKIYESNLFLTNLREFLELEPRIRESTNPMKVPNPVKHGIFFEHVSFSYPGSRSLVLKDVNLHIRPSQIVALVGENGSGKSSLIKLLCRLYDPLDGRICLDGIDLRDFNTFDLRKGISVIFQDYARYNLTARENIQLGNAEGPVDEKKIWSAAERSGADEFISCLEDGYNTTLGKWFEEGTELSVGEWQKVALARAFLRDSQIIILDEPTSSLDPRAEDEVIEKFRSLAEGRMAMIISHRLSTVTKADCIFFLKDGRITESGTHKELMNLGGEYARLFEIQARHYR
ncbi:MAG: ABC transporter ATP-binding protein [Methanotrichaceae archaeon]